METRQLNVRLPVDLLDRVRAAADREKRSVNGQVLWILERALTTDE